MIQKKFHLEEISSVAKWILITSQTCKVLCFYGEMGSGKTTLIKEICKLLDVSDPMSSPSFSIVNQYSTANDSTVYHFDFYRLKDVNEAVQIGIEEYFYSDEYCLIEWPGIVQDLLPDQFVEINIKLVGENQRLITVKN